MVRSRVFAALAGVLLAATVWAAPTASPTFTDPGSAGPDYALQGEYLGQIATVAKKQGVGIQVIALGQGRFQAVMYTGGLPGEGWDPAAALLTDTGARTDNLVTFKLGEYKAVLSGGAVALMNSGGETIAKLASVERRSPTLGQKPPAGATVLFDGTSLDHFTGGGLIEGQLCTHADPPAVDASGENGEKKKPVRGDVVSKESFGDFSLHLEFRTPFMPEARGQARGNSGIYLQNRYECQVLDSFGLKGEDNECGGIYKAGRPAVNMCFPPLTWQTYDIDFVAARFDTSGAKLKNARVSVRHNGVVIHEDRELAAVTPGGLKDESPTGPLKLQDHGNPVMYRNIWIVKKN